MPSIVLSTLNARYIHTAMGLRYLKANLGALADCCLIQEFTIQQQPIDVVEALLAHDPKIIGLGVYIWNIEEMLQVAAMIKQIRPDIVLILGGPEVSYETEQQPIYQYADYVLCGAADILFAETCEEILSGNPPTNKRLQSLPIDLNSLQMPYQLYSDEDIANRVMYVEASRGCPFKCEFCLSSLDKTAKPFDLDAFLAEMQTLFDRGARHFKFVDRTFNLKIAASVRIMEFFLERIDAGIFLHFELIPDHLPQGLMDTISRFPEGSLQFEIGIQSFNPEVQSLISRRQDNEKSITNIRWLMNETKAHLHTDLIAGLPSEDMQSFGEGFDLLASLQPHEIQVGILKRLRGTPIIRHTGAHSMRYNPHPPYNILASDKLSFAEVQRINRFARYWDMIANSGRFKQARPLLLGDKPFERFMAFSDWLYATSKQTHKISLKRLFEFVHRGMLECLDMAEETILPALNNDFAHSGLKGYPPFARDNDIHSNKKATTVLSRQARHLSGKQS
jgi:radical SAM superfamily enzyme YgiQ (UPF0313 family)